MLPHTLLLLNIFPLFPFLKLYIKINLCLIGLIVQKILQEELEGKKKQKKVEKDELKEECSAIIEKQSISVISDDYSDVNLYDSFFTDLECTDGVSTANSLQETPNENMDNKGSSREEKVQSERVTKKEKKKAHNEKEADARNDASPKDIHNTNSRTKRATKATDPGSFSISCSIGSNKFYNVLCDLGSSINLMPLKIYRQLGLGNCKQASTTIQLADGSLLRPHGVVEDVLVQMDRFEFPSDFLIVDMEGNTDVPFILGRPFLATSQAVIDVHKGELKFHIDDDSLIFSIDDRSSPRSMNECCVVYTVEIDRKEVMKKGRIKSRFLKTGAYFDFKYLDDR